MLMSSGQKDLSYLPSRASYQAIVNSLRFDCLVFFKVAGSRVLALWNTSLSFERVVFS